MPAAAAVLRQHHPVVAAGAEDVHGAGGVSLMTAAVASLDRRDVPEHRSARGGALASLMCRAVHTKARRASDLPANGVDRIVQSVDDMIEGAIRRQFVDGNVGRGRWLRPGDKAGACRE